jgi:DNA replicative helicase MCM subunit Mcm2 (Cdc46/Mcm family)
MTNHDLFQQRLAEVILEKFESLSSKRRDDLATDADKHSLEFLEEVIALARNRVSVELNEKNVSEGKEAWVERTSESHNPHIRLHGGTLEDDPPKMSL